MPILLNIDTATENASVCITKEDIVLGIAENADQKNHAAFLQPAIQKLLGDTGVTFAEIDAVAVTAGPGSYTGLRVGMASAKGLCYALNKPLITVNTLEVMALAAIQQDQLMANTSNITTYYCPMIDARRMEVFTAMYSSLLEEILSPAAMILDEKSFTTEAEKQRIVFSGNGSEKLAGLIKAAGFVFSKVSHNATHLSVLAAQHFQKNQFASLAYAEPVYLKEFFNTSKPSK